MKKPQPNNRPINDILAEAYAKARVTKRRQRVKFSKKQFLKENPNSPDPKLALVGNKVVIDFDVYERISVKDLRRMINDNPDHPIAVKLRLATMSLEENRTVALLVQDLQDIREGHSRLILPPGSFTPDEAKNVNEVQGQDGERMGPVDDPTGCLDDRGIRLPAEGGKDPADSSPG